MGDVSPYAPASCLNLPKHFGSLYLESVFFPHGQKPASAVSVFKQAILRYPLSLPVGFSYIFSAHKKTGTFMTNVPAPLNHLCGYGVV